MMQHVSEPARAITERLRKERMRKLIVIYFATLAMLIVGYMLAPEPREMTGTELFGLWLRISSIFLLGYGVGKFWPWP